MPLFTLNRPGQLLLVVGVNYVTAGVQYLVAANGSVTPFALSLNTAACKYPLICHTSFPIIRTKLVIRTVADCVDVMNTLLLPRDGTRHTVTHGAGGLDIQYLSVLALLQQAAVLLLLVAVSAQ